jgi:two-component system, NarL family, response regulator NreC
MIRMVLADDHVIVRQGFQQLLSQQADFAVVGEAGDGATTLRLVKELQPDVLVLDMVMPGLSGLEVLGQMQQTSPQTRVVILSMHDDRGYVLRALRSGALAYLLKESSAQELIQAIRLVMSGRHYLSAPLVEHVIAACLHPEPISPVDCYAALSSREREVLRLIGDGLTNHQIAVTLVVNRRTIDTYRRRLIKKLGLHSQIELLRYALRHTPSPNN